MSVEPLFMVARPYCPSFGQVGGVVTAPPAPAPIAGIEAVIVPLTVALLSMDTDHVCGYWPGFPWQVVPAEQLTSLAPEAIPVPEIVIPGAKVPLPTALTLIVPAPLVPVAVNEAVNGNWQLEPIPYPMASAAVDP